MDKITARGRDLFAAADVVQVTFTAWAACRLHPRSGTPLHLAAADSLALAIDPWTVWAEQMLDDRQVTPIIFTDPARSLRVELRATQAEVARLHALLAELPDDLGGAWAARVRAELRDAGDE